MQFHKEGICHCKCQINYDVKLYIVLLFQGALAAWMPTFKFNFLIDILCLIIQFFCLQGPLGHAVLVLIVQITIIHVVLFCSLFSSED